jgi:hypothetical protein
VLAYAACLVLLVQTKREKAVMRTWAFYVLSIGSGLVVLRYAKLHLVELPQVLALREHPEVGQHRGWYAIPVGWHGA